MRHMIVVFLGFVLLAGATYGNCEMTKKEMDKKELLKKFPNLSSGELSETPIKDLYEVVAGDQIFYWNQDGYIIFGEIFDKNGRSLTAERREQLWNAKVSRVPLSKAIKIGEGKNIVVEFTDPDCPYCRKVNEFFSKRNDVTRYVFLYPLDIHKNAASKSAFILSSKDQISAHHEVFAGKYDNMPVPAQSANAMKMVDESVNIARSIGIRGTPMLWINGSYVNGADTKLIATLLEGRKEVK